VATSYTVLVVERTDVVRQTAKRALAERGCRVIEAASTSEALAVLTRPETHVDLVLIGSVGGPPEGPEMDRAGPESPTRSNHPCP